MDKLSRNKKIMFIGIGIIVLYFILKPKTSSAANITPMPIPVPPVPTPQPAIVCPSGSIPCPNNPTKCKQIGVDYIVDPCA